jgi:cell division septation protein DedD
MNEQPDDYAALKRRLLGRIAFAVVVLAGLLASLAVFDRMNAPEPVPEKRAVAAVQPADTAIKAATKEMPLPDTIKSEVTRPESDAADASTGSPVPENSATPQTPMSQSPPVEKSLTKPATGRHALMRSPEAAAPPVPREPKAAKAVPSAPLANTGSEAAPASRPLALATERPFALQLGVFSDIANAEELRAKLEKAGIRASIEARVHVGPFATRAEADAARAKLRELGISEAVLFSMKGRKTP